MDKLIRTATVSESLDCLLKGQLRFLKQYFDVAGVSSEGAFLETVHEREGIRTVSVHMERQISPLRDLVALFRLYRLFKRENPQIVHSITPKAGLLSMLAAKMAGVPIRMHTFTGLVFPSRTGWVRKILVNTNRLLCWSATNLYPEGQGVKNDLVRFKITKKPLKILANGNVNGIDLDYFNPTNFPETQQKKLSGQLGIKKEDFVFVFVGRIVGDKGINELVSAFEDLNNPQTKLLLVGAMEANLDPLEQETLKVIKENKNILSVGFQKDIRPYLAMAHVLVFPSYREGFPNVVLQAGAMTLPAIVTDINGCNEIIEEGKNGIIIPKKDVPNLKKAMLKMMTQDEFREELKANTRKMIAGRYEQKLVWQSVLAEYKRLLAERKPRNTAKD